MDIKKTSYKKLSKLLSTFEKKVLSLNSAERFRTDPWYNSRLTLCSFTIRLVMKQSVILRCLRRVC